jgi:hypothetical protein
VPLIGAFAMFGTDANAEDRSATDSPAEATIDAFVPWRGKGITFPTGPTQNTLIGAFQGYVYIMTDRGPTDGGEIACPAMLEIDTKSGRQSGHGNCVIVGQGGDRVFSTWTCEGMRLVGCKGTFTVTGGTGRFEGASGEGAMLSRASVRWDAEEISGDITSETAHGIMTLDKLKFIVPARSPTEAE